MFFSFLVHIVVVEYEFIKLLWRFFFVKSSSSLRRCLRSLGFVFSLLCFFELELRFSSSSSKKCISKTHWGTRCLRVRKTGFVVYFVLIPPTRFCWSLFGFQLDSWICLEAPSVWIHNWSLMAVNVPLMPTFRTLKFTSNHGQNSKRCNVLKNRSQ